MIRLYGHLQGSFRTVSEGLRLAFKELGALDGYVIGEAQDFDTEPEGGADSPVAVVVGDPMRILLAHRQGQHKEFWLMLAPNSEGVPPGLKQQLLSGPLVTGFLAPSRWARDVLRREFPEHQVELCVHGVMPEFHWVERSKPDKFVALHLTSTRLGRKCTRELIRAWKCFVDLSGVDGQLRIVSNPQYSAELADYIQGVACPSITMMQGQNQTREDLAELYRSASILVQPSRAEGFGLVPLEARACGVPVVATACTGHSDHVSEGAPGIQVVRSGELSPSDDYWGATAPFVDEHDIFSALCDAHANLTTLTEAAENWAKRLGKDRSWGLGALGIVRKWRRSYE